MTKVVLAERRAFRSFTIETCRAWDVVIEHIIAHDGRRIRLPKTQRLHIAYFHPEVKRGGRGEEQAYSQL